MRTWPTLVVPLPAKDIANDPSSVKAVVAWNSDPHGRALYFSRGAVLHSSDVLHYDVGFYAFRKKALRW
jgi:CMP-2-keto-3-deoxyoctulosonic acid synthetase